MSSVVETVRTQKEITSALSELRRISLEMKNGSHEAYWELVTLVIGEENDGEPPRHDIRETLGMLSGRELSTVYITAKFLEEIRDSFGTASFGFPPEGEPIVQDMMRNIGSFIQAGAFEPKQETDPMGELAKALKNYVSLLEYTDEAAKVVSEPVGWKRL